MITVKKPPTLDELLNTDVDELTSEAVRHIIGLGLIEPQKLTFKDIQRLCGSVSAHIGRQDREIAKTAA